jgi:hypothetical protein
VDSGIITALSTIMQHEMHQDAISLALFNVTTYKDMHEKFVEQDGAMLLVNLLLNPKCDHQTPQNLSSLANIAATKSTTPALMKANIVQALWSPIQKAIPEGLTTAVLDITTANKVRRRASEGKREFHKKSSRRALRARRIQWHR